MTPLRWFVLFAVVFAVVFAVSLPVMHVIEHGLPKLDIHEAVAEEESQEDKDDPVVDAYCLKGLMALSEGQYDKAIAAYTSAINRDPKYSFSYVGRGDAYAAKGEINRALSDYDRAVQLDPTNDAAKVRADAVRAGRNKDEG